MGWQSKGALALLIAVAPQLSGRAAGADMPSLGRGAAPSLLSAGGPRMLGTLAIPIKAERFDASIKRALEDASASPILQRLIAPARGLGRMQQIAFVQRAVAANIRWASDATQWGQHDYWASASQTLTRGAGDMEDRAIVKMQALHALGFGSNDLFLTLARDRVGGPEAVLSARIDGRFYVLDDTGGTPFPVEQRRYEFQPLMSFGWNGAWIHVRPAMTASAATEGSYARNK
jgi:predicted transglutaminase-like cysteine proteinase